MFGEQGSRLTGRQYVTVVADTDRMRWDQKVDSEFVKSTMPVPTNPNDIPTLDLMIAYVDNAIGGSYATISYVDDADQVLQTQIDGLSAGTVPNGDKGDITVSGSGDVWTIDAGVVTLAKMQTIATGKLLGRMTAGTGTIELLTYTAAGQALVEAADAPAQRTALGLGSLATQSGTFSGTSSGTNTGDQDLSSYALTSALASYVPITRTVNSQALSANVTLTTANIADSSNKRYVTDANLTVIGNTSGTNTGDQTLPIDATLTFSDVTTNNASTGMHGFLKKLSNNAAEYMDGTGAWSVPGGGGSVAWGAITGTLSSQTDLNSSLSGKAATGANTDITSVLLSQTGLVVKGGSSNALTIKPNETLTAARTLNLKVNDVSRTIDLSGDLTVSAAATISGTNTGDQDLSGYVPTSRTVNGNALSSNVTITLASLSGASSGANTDITSVLLSQTGLVLKGATSTAVTIKINETVTSARTLNLKTNDADRTIDLSGNLTVSSSATISGTNTGDQTISDATVSFTDITTNNSSTSKHGFLKKLSNTATEFMAGDGNWTTPRRYETYVLACSDLATNLATGTAVAVFRMPGAFTVTEVRASVAVAQTAGSILQFDINESGTSILSTKLTIDNSEKTSTTAATAAVISDSAIADDAEITVDIDTVGTALAKGLVIYIMGYH